MSTEPETKREAALSMSLKMCNALIEKQDAALTRTSNILRMTTDALNQCQNMLEVAERGAILPTAENVMGIVYNMAAPELWKLVDIMEDYRTASPNSWNTIS